MQEDTIFIKYFRESEVGEQTSSISYNALFSPLNEEEGEHTNYQLSYQAFQDVNNSVKLNKKLRQTE